MYEYMYVRCVCMCSVYIVYTAAHYMRGDDVLLCRCSLQIHHAYVPFIVSRDKYVKLCQMHKCLQFNANNLDVIKFYSFIILKEKEKN